MFICIEEYMFIILEHSEWLESDMQTISFLVAGSWFKTEPNRMVRFRFTFVRVPNRTVRFRFGHRVAEPDLNRTTATLLSSAMDMEAPYFSVGILCRLQCISKAVWHMS
jgi:hypothetical protein